MFVKKDNDDFAVILRTEGLIIILARRLCVVHETEFNLAKEGKCERDGYTYLRIKVIDFGDGGINVSRVDGPSYFQTSLDGLFLQR